MSKILRLTLGLVLLVLLQLVIPILADWSCTCSTESDNGNYCAEWDCDTDDAECFPASSTVTLFDGSLKRMDELRIGDQLKSRYGTSDVVVAFLHHDRSQKSKFLEITTDLGNIRLSPDHLIFREDGNVILAHKLVIGDQIQHDSGKYTPILQIHEIEKVGRFAPATQSGEIVVDHFVASCYALYEQQFIAHLIMSPLRVSWYAGAPELVDEGIHPYADWMHWAWKMIAPQVVLDYIS